MSIFCKPNEHLRIRNTKRSCQSH